LRWPDDVEQLARYLRDLDLMAELSCNPARGAELRHRAHQVALRLEAMKQAALAREVAA
jgi:hypothetical protein